MIGGMRTLHRFARMEVTIQYMRCVNSMFWSVRVVHTFKSFTLMTVNDI